MTPSLAVYFNGRFRFVQIILGAITSATGSGRSP